MSPDQPSVNRARATRLRVFGVALAALMLVPVGAASATTDAARHAATGDSGQSAAIDSRPPAVWLASGDKHLKVSPYAGCWQRGDVGDCFGGSPPRPRPSLGKVADPVTLSFALPDWRFKVTVVDRDGQRTKVALKPLSDRSWRLALGQLADGRYRVDIVGHGSRGRLAAAAAFTLV